MIHADVHEMAGKTVELKMKGLPQQPKVFRVEDWWDRVAGKSWMFSDGNPAAMEYAIRGGVDGLPFDDEVVYGKEVGGLGHLVHVSELGALVNS